MALRPGAARQTDGPKADDERPRTAQAMAEIVAAAASAAVELPDTSGVYHELLSGLSGVLVPLQSFEPVLVMDNMVRETRHCFSKATHIQREAVEIQLGGLRKPVDPFVRAPILCRESLTVWFSSLISARVMSIRSASSPSWRSCDSMDCLRNSIRSSSVICCQL